MGTFIRLLILGLRAVIVGMILYGLWRLIRPKAAFTIIVDESGVRSHSGIKTPEQRRLLEVLQKTRFVEGRMKISGRHDENGRLVLWFSGRVSQEAQQQIRNFLVNEV